MTDNEQKAEYRLIIFISLLSLGFASLLNLWFSATTMVFVWTITGGILVLLFMRFLFVFTSLPPRPKI